MLLIQSNILPAIHLLEQVKICLKTTVKTRILHHQASEDRSFQIIGYLRANDEEQITLNDFKEVADSFLKDSPQQNGLNINCKSN